MARYDGGKLQGVIPELKRLFEQEFQQTYPCGVCDIETDDLQTHEYQGSFDAKMALSVGVAWRNGGFTLKLIWPTR